MQIIFEELKTHLAHRKQMKKRLWQLNKKMNKNIISSDELDELIIIASHLLTTSVGMMIAHSLCRRIFAKQSNF